MGKQLVERRSPAVVAPARVGADATGRPVDIASRPSERGRKAAEAYLRTQPWPGGPREGDG